MRALHRGIVLALGLVVAGVARAQDTTAAALARQRVITLDEAIRIALTQGINVRLARNAISLDSLSVKQARNQFLPNLNGSVQTSQGILNGPQGQNSFGLSGGLSSNVTLYNGRQNTNALRQAELFQQASTAGLARTRQTTVFVVATDYLDLITQQEQLRVQLENLAAQQEELTQIDAFARAGTRPIGDLYQQQAATASARLAVANARRSVELSRIALIQELMLDPRLDYTFEAPTAQAGPRAPALNRDSLMAVAIAQRSDVQGEILRVRAAEQEVKIAEGLRMPVVSATGGYSSAYNSAGDGAFLAQLNQRRGGSIGVGVSIPIFDRGNASISRQRAQVQLENETITLNELEQNVALEVRRALLDYQTAQEQLDASTVQQAAAAQALEATQARYRVGLATFVEVTLARAQLVQAQSAVVSARSSLAFQRALMSYYTGVLDPRSVDIGR